MGWSWQLAVLDMAGTTVRDDGLVEAAVAAAVKHVEPGRRVSAEDFTASRGLPKADLFSALFPENPNMAAGALSTFEDELIRQARRGAVHAIADADRAFRALRSRGTRVTLTTGFPDEVVAAIIDSLGWGEAVDEILTPGGLGRGRPYPDLVLRAALNAEVESMSRVVVCGDTVNDLITGHRAGAGVVAGVLTGAHDWHRLSTVAPTHLLESIAELPDALRATPPARALAITAP